MFRSLLCATLSFLLFSLAGRHAAAHPHCWVDYTPRVIVDESGITHIELTWRFDAMSSKMFIGDCDLNKDGRFSGPAELKNVTDFYQKPTANKKYYIALEQSGKALDLNDIEWLGAAIVDKTFVTWKMKVACPLPQQEMEQALTLRVMDMTMFMAFRFKSEDSVEKDLVKLQPIKDRTHSCRIVLPGRVKGAGKVAAERMAPPEPPAPLHKRLWNSFLVLQSRWNRRLSDTLATTQTNMTLKTLLLLFAFASGYGLIHAAGPGHGKTLVAGFFFQHESSLVHAPIFAFLISCFHVGVAVVLALLFSTVLSSYRGYERMALQSYVSFAVGVGIALFGLYLIGRALTGKKEEERKVDLRGNMLKVAFAAGIIPCPLSIMVLLLAVSMNAWLLGGLTVAGIVLGMFVLLTAVGGAVILSRKALQKRSTEERPWVGALYRKLDLIGAVLILTMGTGLSLLYLPF